MSSIYADVRIGGLMPTSGYADRGWRGVVGHGAEGGLGRAGARGGRFKTVVVEPPVVGASAPDRTDGMAGTRREPGATGLVRGGLPVVDGAGWLHGWVDTGKLKELGRLGRWMSERGLGVEVLDEGRVEEFPADLRSRGHRRVPRLGSFALLLDLLRDRQVIGGKVAPAPTALDMVIGRYSRHWGRQHDPRVRVEAKDPLAVLDSGWGCSGQQSGQSAQHWSQAQLGHTHTRVTSSPSKRPGASTEQHSRSASPSRWSASS